MGKIMLNGVDYSSSTATESTTAAHNKANMAYNLASNINARLNAPNISFASGSNASGNYSIALGYNTRAYGESSVAIGDIAYALANSATAIGIVSNAAKRNSTAIGSSAKALGNNATALGSMANANDTCSVALGYKALASDHGDIAIGYEANAIMPHTTALGSYVNATYNQSTAIGSCTNATKQSSTALGFSAKALGNYSTALGTNAHTASANTIQLGDPINLSSITARVGITTTSDERDKADISELEYGAVKFLKKVRAIRYVFNHREMYINEEALSDEEMKIRSTYGLCAYNKEDHASGTKKGNRKRVGVSAQDVQRALEDTFGSASYANLVNNNLFDFNPSEIPEDVESQLSINYEGFIPFLIKAVQELDERINVLENGGSPS